MIKRSKVKTQCGHLPGHGITAGEYEKISDMMEANRQKMRDAGVLSCLIVGSGISADEYAAMAEEQARNERDGVNFDD